jgi:two-component system, cell cycle sensor histidine kinase and response regulator CckA
VWQLKHSPLHSSVFALVLTAAALLVSLLLRPVLAPHFFLPFLAAVLASAWLYGRVGGLTATALATAVLGFLLAELRGAPPVTNVNVAVGVISFAGMALLGVWVISGWLTSRSMLAATLSSIGDGVLATDREERITFLNPVAEALAGWPRHDAMGKPLSEVLKVIEEGSRAPAASPVTAAMREGAPAHNAAPILLVTKDKTEIPIEQTAAPLGDERGRLKGAILVFRDITARRQLEEQLSHARKMDAVGRLASGVSGDFNNVLTVITGYSELLRSQMSAASPMRRYADEILYAAERAAGLTRQLLAFSQGAAAQPKVLDLNALITEMKPMLHRMLGQAVELIVLPGPSLGRVRVDPAQMQQVIVNLASNARDAMPNGGKLVIETANLEVEEGSGKKSGVKPGAYVMLAVSDTGCGMDAETRARLFEPFFTTKAQGQGSGLGLSIVYGAVKQADGHITVYSQVNCGTIFEIYLPRITDALDAPRMRPVTRNGSETILVVDDEEGVRRLVGAVLQNGGYTVLEAANGSAALTVYEKNAHKIDLVLADVVMPQMNGLELGQRLTDQNPRLPVLYMSGYRDTPLGSLPGKAVKAFLNKPFTPDTLLAKVREVLDAQAA